MALSLGGAWVLAVAANPPQQTVIVESGGPYVVGWFTLAIINAGLAQSKHRSGLNWFLVSLLLGPIATFVLVAFCKPLA
jgi:hypothetical protein